MKLDEKQIYLVYINPLNKNYKGEIVYEFLFSKQNDITGDDWDITPSSSGEVTPPKIDNLDMVGTLTTNHIELNLVLNSDDFGMYDAMENIIALGWETDTPEYQERLVFHYGETLESVKDKLYTRELEFEIKEIE